MPEQLWFTELLNRLFGRPVAGLMESFHIHMKYPEAPIANSVAMEVLVCLFLILLFIAVRSRLSVDKPAGLQHVFEMVHGFIYLQTVLPQAHEAVAKAQRRGDFLGKAVLFQLVPIGLGDAGTPRTHRGKCPARTIR